MTEAGPLSTAQVDRLGERMADADTISDADLLVLQAFREEHVDALRSVQQTLTDILGSVPQTSRIKTIQTLHEKLRRQPTKLSRMQDIAGVRIVQEMDRLEQDDVVRAIVAAFPGARVQDRRAAPSHGYRAVHVVVRVGRCPVEIQVRTRAQDLWAQIVERLGDVWGRQIRYGGTPNDPDVDIGGGTRAQFWQIVQQWSGLIAQIEEAIADQNFAAGVDPETGAQRFDPDDLRHRMHEGLADLAEFVQRSEGL